MTKLLSIATATLVLAFPAIANTSNETTQAQLAAETELAASVCPLSDEVLAGIAELREYGTRFEPVIALIIAEAAKPGWTWGPACDAALEVAAQADQ